MCDPGLSQISHVLTCIAALLAHLNALSGTGVHLRARAWPNHPMLIGAAALPVYLTCAEGGHVRVRAWPAPLC